MGKQTESPAPAGNVQRVAVDRLTDGERQDLEAQGKDLSGDYVDIELDQRQPPVDPAAQERSAVAKQMESVVAEPAPGAPEPPPAAQEEIQELREENDRLKAAIEEKPDHCPRCAWPVATKIEHEPTNEDIVNFLESVCAGEVFTKSYELYGGAVEIGFRTRYSIEMEAVKDHVTEETGGIISDDMLFLTDELVFLTSLDRLKTARGEKVFTPLKDLLKQREEFRSKGQAVKSVVQLLRERVEDIPSHIRIVIRQKYVEFSAIVEHLMTKSTDPKYWKGTTASA